MSVQEINILLVDDDDGHAELIELNLRQCKIDNNILHFQDGEKMILHLMEQKAPLTQQYLIILDLNMPIMNGYETLKWIRNHNYTKNIPIIMLSSIKSEEKIALCYELGCNIYVHKPLEYEAFSKAIYELGLFLKTAKLPNTKTIFTRNEQTQGITY